MPTRYLLDTNILSDLLKNPQGKAAQRVSALPSEERDLLATSIIVAAKLRYGVAKSGSSILTGRVDQLLEAIEILPLEQKADQRYGRIRMQLEKVGTSIGGNDLLIAAQALAIDARIQAHQGAPRRELAAFLIRKRTEPLEKRVLELKIEILAHGATLGKKLVRLLVRDHHIRKLASIRRTMHWRSSGFYLRRRPARQAEPARRVSVDPGLMVSLLRWWRGVSFAKTLSGPPHHPRSNVSLSG